MEENLDTNVEEQDQAFTSLQHKLCEAWQEDTKSNLLYIKRSLNWLGLNGDNYDECKFFNQLVVLGKMLSEDTANNLNTTQNNSISADQALTERAKMTGDKNILDILNNKGHSMHSSMIAKLNELNKIITTNK